MTLINHKHRNTCEKPLVSTKGHITKAGVTGTSAENPV